MSMAKSRDKERLETLLKQDKTELNDCSKAAALADFKRVAEEYFQTNGGFLLTAHEGKHGTEVTFSFRMVRAKNFTKLPS